MSKAIKRALRVEFESKGAAKLERQVNGVGKGIEAAGKKGAKAMDEAEKATVKASKAMADSLEPIDQSFAGFDRLNSILGKVTMVGGLVAGAFGIVAAALSAAKNAAWEGSTAAKAMTIEMDTMAAAAGPAAAAVEKLARVSSQYALVQSVKVAVAVDEARDAVAFWSASVVSMEEALDSSRAALSETAKAWEDAGRPVGELGRQFLNAKDTVALLEARIVVANARLHAQRQAFANASQAAKDYSDELRTVDKAVGAVSGAIKRGAGAYADAAAWLWELDKAGQATAKTMNSVAKATEDVEDALDKAAEKARLAMQALADRRAAENFARLSGQLDDVARMTRAFDAARAEGERQAAALGAEHNDMIRERIRLTVGVTDAQRDAVSATTGGLEEMAAASEQWGAGATAIQAAQMLASGIKAGADAGDYGAESLAAFATGNPVAGAGLLAASLAKVASAAAYAKGLAQLGEGGGGGISASPPAGASGGSAPSGVSDLTEPRDGGPSTININLSGPLAGMGRYLVAEVNEEGRRRGGARISRASIRG